MASIQSSCFHGSIATQLDLYQMSSTRCLKLRNVMRASRKEEILVSNTMMAMRHLFLYQKMKEKLGYKPVALISSGSL